MYSIKAYQCVSRSEVHFLKVQIDYYKMTSMAHQSRAGRSRGYRVGCPTLWVGRGGTVRCVYLLSFIVDAMHTSYNRLSGQFERLFTTQSASAPAIIVI